MQNHYWPKLKAAGRQILTKEININSLHHIVQELLHQMGKSTMKITVDVDSENSM